MMKWREIGAIMNKCSGGCGGCGCRDRQTILPPLSEEEKLTAFITNEINFLKRDHNEFRPQSEERILELQNRLKDTQRKLELN